MMRISIRYQVLGLVAAILLGAMASYLSWATRMFAEDKVAYIFGVNEQLAATLSEEVRTQLLNLADKLHYYALEQMAALDERRDPERAARSLFQADGDVVALELFRRGPHGFTSVHRFEPEERLEAFGLRRKDLEASRRLFPLVPEHVEVAGIVLRNASYGPDALIRVGVSTGDGRAVVIADMRPDRLLRTFQRSKDHLVYLVDERGEVLVHPADAGRVLNHENASGNPLVRLALESPLALQIREEVTEQGVVLGTYAHVDLGQRMSVLVEVPKAEALRASSRLQRQSVLFGLFVMSVSFLASIFLSRRLTAPLRALDEATHRISQGDFGAQVTVKTRNEIGALAAAFNRMSQELQEREARLMESNAQLVQSEKLSALGEMSAGLAHEVKNPMVGIVGFSELGLGAQTLEEAHEFFSLIQADARRADGILQGLLAFARQEQAQMESLELTPVVSAGVRLCYHQLTIKGVRVQQAYAEGLPRIRGSANQLTQVLLNLMMNAAQAMEGRPEKVLAISTARGGEGDVEIRVRDTGHGMSPAVLAKLFTPFFTTKPKGKGTGLGLSVSRNIVQQHGGRLEVESAVGQGTTFCIRLPPESSAAAPAGAPVATEAPRAAVG
jgi:signal transduction histidine kinase